MADVVSSDGHCTVRLHTDWASVLVWTDLTGTITVRRNGVDIATMTPGRQIFYDHYFTPLGSPSTYTVTNGSTTSTGATITVPADPQQRTWLKSAVDPNLSVPLMQQPFDEISNEQQVGEFRILGDDKPFVVFGDLGARRSTLRFTCYTDQQRDNLYRLLASKASIYYQPPALAGEDAGWYAARGASRQWVKLAAGSTIGHYWLMTIPVVETRQPASSALGNIIPGWGWDDVKATWATWDALKAAKATWLDVVKHGVS